MTSPNLPPPVVAHLAALLDTAKRAPLKAAHNAMSAHYRDGGHSRAAVPDAAAALAYAVARMPATYAACVRAFDLVSMRMGTWQPRSLLDLGSGPGTAALAATAAWPGIERGLLVEPNAELGAIATALLATTALGPVGHEAQDIHRIPVPAAADLVTLSYVLAEQVLETVPGLVQRISPSIGRLIVIVEPGTPAGYARILAARDALVAAGLRIVAPCPHDYTCPLANGDWCHFSVRLARSAAHMQLKDAHVPFEDERFSFVAAVRGDERPAWGRTIGPASVEKGFVDLKLCTRPGLEARRVRRRDAAAYKAAKSLAWGDEIDAEALVGRDAT